MSMTMAAPGVGITIVAGTTATEVRYVPSNPIAFSCQLMNRRSSSERTLPSRWSDPSTIESSIVRRVSKSLSVIACRKTTRSFTPPKKIGVRRVRNGVNLRLLRRIHASLNPVQVQRRRFCGRDRLKRPDAHKVPCDPQPRPRRRSGLCGLPTMPEVGQKVLQNCVLAEVPE